MQDPAYNTNSNSSNNPPAGQDGSAAIDNETSRQAAADLIRQKVAAAYGTEPNARQELAEVQAATRPLSKHQAYMQQLNQSGKSIVEIQAAWHDYYANLPVHEKYEVWREFYSSQPGSSSVQQAPTTVSPAAAQTSGFSPTAHQSIVQPAAASIQSSAAPTGTNLPTLVPTAKYGKPFVSTPTEEPADTSTADDIRDRIRKTAAKSSRPKKQSPLRSMAFGLATGTVVMFIFLFSFFNEVFLAPFIQPSRHASETPVIVDPASAVVGSTPKVIIPKINVEIPVDYTQTSIDNKAIEAALDSGVVHYPTTAKPGQNGNAVFFGHSSNNIFNKGKYKFAFVLLHELVEGDTFYLTNEGKVYAYKVVQRRVVEPTEVSVLGPVAGKTATATLITCDPPGTSLKRLVVVGEQISPAPDVNQQPATPAPILAASEQTSLPGDGPTLWSRMWRSLF